MRAAGWIVLALLAGGATTGPGCGGTDAPCTVSLGAYRILLPLGATEPPPAMVWLHGWGGSAEAVTKGDAGIAARLAARGYALIAPDGLAAAGTEGRRGWAVVPGRAWPRDDVAFLAEVIENAETLHAIDRDRVLLAGFSLGGSMTWTAACAAPSLARGYAPVAGALWEPLPAGCAGPASLLHTHGWTDRTVPLEGRPLSGGALVQGDVWESLSILRQTDGCAGRQPETATAADDSWQRHWTDCAHGRIDLDLHPGGHVIPDGWIDRALDWFEALEGG